MTSFLRKILLGLGFAALGLFAFHSVHAQVVNDYYYTDPYYGNSYGYNYSYNNGYDQSAYVAQLLQIIQQLEAQIQSLSTQGYNPYGTSYNPYYYGTTGGYNYYPVYEYEDDYYSSGSRPRVETKSARDVDEDSAELRGDVDMNDYRNGVVFFVYGQDESMIEDVEGDYDTYDDVRDDEEDDDFEVVRVDNDLDGDDSYNEDVRNLEDNKDYYFVICVEYEYNNNDERLECGDVEDFETDDNGSNNDEPDASTHSATNIDDDRATLRGEVDMNDFDNGRVFFVYGEDENDVEDVEHEDSYNDIDEHGDDLQKDTVDTDLDGSASYSYNALGLDSDTRHYFRICVEYDDDGDDAMVCGDVEDFETDN
ncbi:hypothetical protein KC901_01795 [Patescibacteria group bacterium]|nr:hypothetical protein [Patescibacteria group bacterium]